MRAEKKFLVDEVTTHLKKSDYVILTNFTKLTVADTAELAIFIGAHGPAAWVVTVIAYPVLAVVAHRHELLLRIA